MPICIKIASTTNHQFCTPLMTLYVSILEQNPAVEFEFFVIADTLTTLDFHYLKTIEHQYANCQKITFLSVDPKAYATAATNQRIIQAAYYRIDLPEILRRETRLLYLDSDMICRGDLRPLWQAPLQGKLIGAVEDAGYVENRLNQMQIAYHHRRYFNSGLMLMDLTAWRQHRISQQVKAFIKVRATQLRYHDQDALNAILVDRWLPLHPKYNAQSKLLWRQQQHFDPTVEHQNTVARSSPVLIHYAGFRKPWHPEIWHPATAAYQAYQPIVQRLKLKAAEKPYVPNTSCTSQH